MKIKIAILSLFILVFCVNVFAQKGNRFNISFFPKGNFNAYSVNYYKLDKYFPDEKNTEMIQAGAFNASLGVAGNIPLSECFAFYPRIGYTKLRGLQYTATTLYPGAPDSLNILGNIAETRFYFVSADFLLKYYLPLGKSQKYYLYGGLRTDFLLWDDEALYNNESIFEGMNDFNLSYVGGLGFDFWKGFYFNLEYSNNITNFIKNDRYLIRYFSVSASLGVYVF
jgi:hypothetical protein